MSLGEGVLAALGKFEDAKIYPALIEAAGKPGVANYLKKRSGQDFGIDVAKWRAWWSARK